MGNRPFFITWQSQDSDHFFQYEKANGATFILKDGKKIMDLSSISYHAAFGSNNPEIIKAIAKQSVRFSVSNPKAMFSLKDEVSFELLEHLKKKTGKILYTVSGAESVENALKMARYTTKKKIILARERSYHGASLGALSVTGDWRNKAHATPKDWTVRIPEPNEPNAIEKTRAIIKKVGPDKIAAFCLETITGGNGVIIASKEWWQGIQKICDEFGILLILDEVVCGFGRTGKNFGFHHYPIKPDLVCMAKAITGGHIPFGAVWVSEKISKAFDHEVFSFGLTNYAHPLGLAATKKVLQILERPKFKQNLKALEVILKKYMKSFAKFQCVKEVRHIGLLAAVELKEKDDYFFKLLKKEIFVSQIGNSFIFCPAYILSPKQLELGLKKFESLLMEIEHEFKGIQKRNRSA